VYINLTDLKSAWVFVIRWNVTQSFVSNYDVKCILISRDIRNNTIQYHFLAVIFMRFFKFIPYLCSKSKRI